MGHKSAALFVTTLFGIISPLAANEMVNDTEYECMNSPNGIV